jgi:hypothetical protein
MRIAIPLLFLAILTITGISTYIFHEKRADVAVAIVGSFWGFLLTQAGLIIYERHKQKEELISMLVSVRTELLMNRGTVFWIDYLLDNELNEKDVHSLGFSGVDQINEKAIENIIMSHLTYKYASKRFAAKSALVIYQTVLTFKREIPTDKVDGADKERYAGINFNKVLKAFDTLVELLDSEGRRLCGKQRWIDLTKTDEALLETPVLTCLKCGAEVTDEEAACGKCGTETVEARRRIARYSGLVVLAVLATFLFVFAFAQAALGMALARRERVAPQNGLTTHSARPPDLSTPRLRIMPRDGGDGPRAPFPAFGTRQSRKRTGAARVRA